jgi:hypothetical protein
MTVAGVYIILFIGPRAPRPYACNARCSHAGGAASVLDGQLAARAVVRRGVGLL